MVEKRYQGYDSQFQYNFYAWSHFRFWHHQGQSADTEAFKENQLPTTKLSVSTFAGFIKAIMAEMNKYDYMKGFYVIIADAPIHADYPMRIFLLIRMISI